MSQKTDVMAIHSGSAVRAAQPYDSNRIADLAAQLGYQCSGQQIRKRLGGMQDPKQYAVYVAEFPGGLVAGWVGVYVFRTVELDAVAEISGLIVDENTRSSGIGKILLDAAENWARQVGCNAISVHSNVTRDQAHRFYMNNGFEPVKTQRIFRKTF